MAKKKTQSKKHKFKHAEPALSTGHLETDQHRHASETVSGLVQQRAGAAGINAGSMVARDFSYVTTDLRRIMVMALGLVVLELILWGLLSNTGLGEAVYRAVQV